MLESLDEKKKQVQTITVVFRILNVRFEVTFIFRYLSYGTLFAVSGVLMLKCFSLGNNLCSKNKVTIVIMRKWGVSGVNWDIYYSCSIVTNVVVIIPMRISHIAIISCSSASSSSNDSGGSSSSSSKHSFSSSHAWVIC